MYCIDSELCFLPSHVASSGVIIMVSFGFKVVFRPVSAGIRIVENAIDNPKSTIRRFFAELAKIFQK